MHGALEGAKDAVSDILCNNIISQLSNARGSKGWAANSAGSTRNFMEFLDEFVLLKIGL